MFYHVERKKVKQSIDFKSIGAHRMLIFLLAIAVAVRFQNLSFSDFDYVLRLLFYVSNIYMKLNTAFTKNEFFALYFKILRNLDSDIKDMGFLIIKGRGIPVKNFEDF